MRRAAVLVAVCACTPPGGDPPPTGNPDSGAGPSDGGGDGGGDPDAEPPTSAALAEILPRERFEQMFPHRGDDLCEGAFYTYDAFLTAAARFPGFAATGTASQRRREVAAFLANASHETTGGYPTAPDGAHTWGLCWIEEGPGVPRELMGSYCVAVPDWPCADGQKYYGRGPMQLSYNFNYGPAGVALGADLLADPGRLATDPELSFAAALWFWMTPQAPKPSCHDVMTGGWSPTAADTTAGRVAGFGLSIDIINGGVECGGTTPPQVEDRIAFYQRYTDLLGVAPGDHLDCSTMDPY